MNADILQGRWKQLRGEAKQRWGRLTDGDLDRVEGKIDQLVGLVQEKYGYSREQAAEKVDGFISESSAKLQEGTQKTLTSVEQTFDAYSWQVVVVAFCLGILLGLLLRPDRSTSS